MSSLHFFSNYLFIHSFICKMSHVIQDPLNVKNPSNSSARSKGWGWGTTQTAGEEIQEYRGLHVIGI